jgi:hypothetical protein
MRARPVFAAYLVFVLAGLAYFILIGALGR